MRNKTKGNSILIMISLEDEFISLVYDKGVKISDSFYQNKFYYS
jgi:hypothetical protein